MKKTIILSDSDDMEVCSPAGVTYLLGIYKKWARKGQGRPDVYLSCRGGCVESALAIYDLLVAMNVRRILVAGYCHSSGVIILQAGEIRSLLPHVTMLCHEGYWEVSGAPGETKQQVRSYDKLGKEVVNILSRRSGLKASTIRKVDRKSRTLSAKQAVKLGLADEIIYGA